MAYQTILCEKSNRIARITLNRPEKLNALSVQLRHEIVAALRDAEQDGEINVVILKGAGRAFSAGYDISPSPTRSEAEYTVGKQQSSIRRDIDNMMTSVELSQTGHQPGSRLLPGRRD